MIVLFKHSIKVYLLIFLPIFQSKNVNTFCFLISDASMHVVMMQYRLLQDIASQVFVIAEHARIRAAHHFRSIFHQ